jgi:glycosyltransferase involved in cell wall biosynthesis
MQKTRALWVVDGLAEDAGTERQVLNLGRRLRDRLDIHVVTFQASEPAVAAAGLRFTGFPMEAIWTPHGLWQLARIGRLIRSEKMQIVHGFMPKSSIAAAFSGAMAGAPVVITSRRSLGYHYTRGSLLLTRIANRVTTRVLANSQGARIAAAECEGLNLNQIDVLYNGVDTQKFYPPGPVLEDTEIPVPASSRIVGIVANYRPVKNLGLFIRSAAIVARRFPDAWFLLVGTGTLESSLRALAAELGISECVIFTSGKGQVLPYLHRMAVGCLCSSSEGFSNSILEYMATGLPVVATDVGGNREAIEDGRTGYLVAEPTPEAFAGPVIRLLEDDVLRSRMGQAGLDRCRQKFEFGYAADQLAEYYDSLLGTPAASGVYAGTNGS